MMVMLILCTLFGATAHVPGRIKAYLVAVCAAAPILWLGVHWFGETSFAYALEYYAVTCVTLATAVLITASSRMTYLTAFIGACVSVLLVLMTYPHLARPMKSWEWFYLAESAIAGGCGASLMFQTWQMPRRDIYAAIGLLWLAQAAFRAEFALNAKESLWLWLNDRVPVVLVCLAFVWIGARSRLIRWEFDSAIG